MNRSLALLAPLAVLLLAGCSPTKEKCFSPNIECGGKCVDGSRDPSNCGGCGVTCGPGRTCCGVCTDVAGDAANCGACGARCPTGGSCNSSTCSCPPATPTVCGSNPGKCVDLDSDPVFCGTCAQACWSPLLVSTLDATCSSGTCNCSGSGTSCPGESPQCVNIVNGDPTNCAACGRACAPHATCAASACVCGAVAFPDDCGADPGGTGCVNFATDPAHCGACGTTCSGATPSCSSGKCCPAGQTNCSGTCIDTRTSAANCGACGHACAAGQTCSAGSCVCAGATPVACDGSCCAGTACCGGGSTCQTGHDNGLGQLFFDCTPIGSATRDTALAAAQAWGASIISEPLGLCGGGSSCTAGQKTGQCAIWCWGGLLTGRVRTSAEPSCTFASCPFDPTTFSFWPTP